MVGFAVIITFCLILIFAAIFWLVSRQKVSQTAGRLTNSPLGRLLAWGYPLVLAVAVLLYYTLPADNLYHAESVSPYAPYFDSELNMAVQKLLDADDPALLTTAEIAEVPLEHTTLPLAGDTLDIRIPWDNIRVSRTPSADGTLLLHYFPGMLNIAGFKADDLIQPKISDFTLDGQDRLIIDGLDMDSLDQTPFINVIVWRTPGLVSQFPASTPPVYRQFTTSIDSALILQVPADTTVTYFGDPLEKGQRLPQ